MSRNFHQTSKLICLERYQKINMTAQFLRLWYSSKKQNVRNSEPARDLQFFSCNIKSKRDNSMKLQKNLAQ